MNELSSLGMILLFALLAGHLVKFLRIPEVTGYIMAGVMVGPWGFDWITHENLRTLEVFSQVALGLILFSIGSVFEFERFRTMGRRVVLITVIESVLAFVLVSGGMLLLQQPWQISTLLGAIAIETAAASTLMVMRETNSEGPLTDTLTGIIAINNVFCLIAFSIVAAGIEMQSTASVGLMESAYLVIYPLVWQIVGAVALGFLIGWLLVSWGSQVVEHGETLILLAGSILLAVGLANLLDLSPLVASLSLGATMVNLSSRSRALFGVLSRTDPPLYAIFFVIAGADLNLGLLPSLGLIGVVYAVGRAAGKLVGASYAARKTGLNPNVQKLLGVAMLSQAGLAIGLVLIVGERFPQLAATVTTVVLAAVVVFELIGPVSTKFALERSGETRGAEAEAPVI